MAILRVDDNDECEYTCRAENSAGEKTCSANLHLIETPAGSKQQGYVDCCSSSIHHYACFSLISMEDIAPSFIRKLRNCTVIEGQRAKFDCFISGQPSPTIRWLINGVAIDIDANRRKYSSDVQSNGKVTLTIEDCTQEEAGEVTIIVQNRAGSTQCSAELIVERMSQRLFTQGAGEDRYLFALAYHESNRLKRRVSFDVPDLADTSKKSGAPPLPPTRLLLTPHSKSSLNLSWDHSPSHSRAQPCTYIVEVRDPRTYSWSTYVSGLPGKSREITSLEIVIGFCLSSQTRVCNYET